MLPLAYYIVKVMICSAVLYAYYWLALRNKNFHVYNRFFLLGATGLSLLLPLIRIDFWNSNAPEEGTVVRILRAVSTSDEYLEAVVIRAQAPGWSTEQWYTLLYLVVSLSMLVVLAHGLLRIAVLLKKYPVQQVGDISFINSNAKGTPFSFFRYIFWNERIDMNTTSGKQIFRHEVAHIQEKHSFDKLFINIILILFWINPVFWIIRKELNMIHEFIADRKAIGNNDTEAFANMILQAAYPQHRFQLANNFFYSPIKRRLLMLTKNNSKAGYIGRLLVLPLAVIIFAAFTFKNKLSLPQPASANGGDAQYISTDTVPTRVPTPYEWDRAAGKKPQEKKIEEVKISPAEKLELRDVLYVIDGKKMEPGFGRTKKLDDVVAPEGIMEVRVWKGQQAIEKYGQEGANGVIEIKTKDITQTVDIKSQPAMDEVVVVGYPAKKVQGVQIAETKNVNVVKADGVQEVVVNGYPSKKVQGEEVTVVGYSVRRDGRQEVVVNDYPAKTVAGVQLNETKEQPVTLKLNGRVDEVVIDGYPTVKQPGDKPVFVKVEKEAAFPGGVDGWKAYLMKNIKASLPVDEGWKAGTYSVIVQFIVYSDGRIGDVKTINYKGTKTAAHCIDIIKNGPKWIPAMQNDKAVSSYRKQPITFVVEDQP